MAKNKGYGFSVRINGTSDITPKLFKLNGLNILEIFPNINFYDYTKIYNRINLLSEYSNYNLTYSFNGHNWEKCEEAINNGMNVAVVFLNKLPKQYKGYTVINGDESDLRYLDTKKVIVGLKYKLVKNDKSIDKESNAFIITDHISELVSI